MTSGRRLVLSYNLIHQSSGTVAPSLQNVQSANTFLRTVLLNWSTNKYPGSPRIVAHLLQQTYKLNELKVSALRGEDVQKARYLMDVARELGFTICFANLHHELSAIVQDEEDEETGEYIRYRRSDGYGGGFMGIYGDSYDPDEVDPEMPDNAESSFELTDIVDLDGRKAFEIDHLRLEQSNLVPEDALDDRDPVQEYDGDVCDSLAASMFVTHILTMCICFSGTSS